ncbi:hypothetical protein [Streptomyces alkaliterrae]|uniref:ESX-1 secretion-associated protein n=1 Tax=Streptomyces alkaliterrae TaxID=2213162 RepID=A0A5P0YW26_9ACTN|nr:hypothetical protein [Streptomyces alkaliterrae]MBB1255930.1 hypothetical protein [Streptomyces alkaliterrae]MBB1261900.1 hypothetical protein [Streptomyces alkaliterrae]MQS04496.1 hypothetical protein [Streptomyces alkaliterrae]
MSDELHVNTDELRRLGASFSTHAYDLGRHLSDFRRRTDLEGMAPSAGAAPFAEPGGGEQVSYAELSEMAEEAGRLVGRLRDRLEEIGSGLRATARNSDDVYEEFVERFREAR